jgi:capsular polysaccharide biosynthesis protein
LQYVAAYSVSLALFILNKLYASGWTALARRFLFLSRFAARRHVDQLGKLLHSLTTKGALPEEVERLCDQILALDPDHAYALSILGSLRLWDGNMQSALRYYQRLDAIDHPERTVSTRLLVSDLMNAELASRGIPYVHTLRNVIVETGYWMVILGDRAFNREVHDRTIANFPRVRGRIAADSRRFIMTLEEPLVRIEEPCILLGGDDNYSHWLERNLIKLCLLEASPGRASLPLLINEDLRGYQRQYLEMLGIAPERLLKVPRDILISCRELDVPTVLRNHPQMRRGIDWLRAKVGSWMNRPSPAGARIYVSRRDTPKRRLVNEEELFSELRKLGFSRIVPGEMSVPEQITAFANASVIVGPHGAGLTNLIFAPPGSTIVEICSKRIAHMPEFRFIAEQMKQRCITIVADRLVGTEDRDMHTDFEVDIGDVLNAVSPFVR